MHPHGHYRSNPSAAGHRTRPVAGPVGTSPHVHYRLPTATGTRTIRPVRQQIFMDGKHPFPETSAPHCFLRAMLYPPCVPHPSIVARPSVNKP